MEASPLIEAMNHRRVPGSWSAYECTPPPGDMNPATLAGRIRRLACPVPRVVAVGGSICIPEAGFTHWMEVQVRTKVLAEDGDHPLNDWTRLSNDQTPPFLCESASRSYEGVEAEDIDKCEPRKVENDIPVCGESIQGILETTDG